ncbi:MAG: hypothetical protein L6U99_11665 [Clostridium sp.]|nr:MAG: hypothetical protein L6U99_11665 [Clostridium sp.]
MLATGRCLGQLNDILANIKKLMEQLFVMVAMLFLDEKNYFFDSPIPKRSVN